MELLRYPAQDREQQSHPLAGKPVNGFVRAMNLALWITFAQTGAEESHG